MDDELGQGGVSQDVTAHGHDEIDEALRDPKLS